MLAKNWKIILVAALLLAAAWLAKRNLSAPLTPPASSAPAREASEKGAPERSAGKQEKRGAPATLAEVDPTLRLDRLEAARAVKYQGASRNIFEVYTPPPPPPPPRPPTPPPSAANPPAAVAPRQPDIPLKFYGVAQPAGSNIKQAFLTDGEEILIAKEGDVVAKYYKINRIGVTSMELEDTRTKKAQLLPLIEE